MATEGERSGVSSRRRFLGCAAGALGVGAAPVPKDPEELIPLRTVYAASEQRGLLKVPSNRILQGENGLKKNLFLDFGPSNLFLVFGEDIEEAMEATFFAFAYTLSVESPVATPGGDRKPSKRLWAFAHFGFAQSDPCAWTVTRASVLPNRVRVAATRPEPRLGATFDSRAYMFWVPLGERKEKALTLEAYDETNKVTLMTCCVVIEV